VLIKEPIIVRLNKTVRISVKIVFSELYKERKYPQELWYEFPVEYEQYITRNSNAFVTALLFLAMRHNDTIEVEGVLSEKYFNGVNKAKDIFKKWWPHWFGETEIIPQKLTTERIKNHPQEVGCCFSGGVDSFYTLYKHYGEREPDSKARVSHGLFALIGPPFSWKKPELYERYFKKNKFELEKLGINLTSAKSNVFDFLSEWDWLYGHGPATISTVLLLENLFSRFLIPSTYQKGHNFRIGTNIETDFLFSTENIEFAHDGSEASRAEKTFALSEWGPTYPLLNVCLERTNDMQNCGKCVKCMRTMVFLELKNKLDQYQMFPKTLNFSDIRKWDLPNEYLRSLTEGLIEEAVRHQRDDIAECLRIALKRSKSTPIKIVRCFQKLLSEVKKAVNQCRSWTIRLRKKVLY